MHKLLIMDARKGHVEVEFAPPEVRTEEAKESRRKAKAVFDEVMGRPGRWTVIAQKPAAVEGLKLTKFDASVEEAIAIAPIVGG